MLHSAEVHVHVSSGQIKFENMQACNYMQLFPTKSHTTWFPIPINNYMYVASFTGLAVANGDNYLLELIPFSLIANALEP